MSCVVIFAYSIIWSTSARLLENYGTGSIWRELFYSALGMLLFIATGNFVSNSAIWIDAEEDDDDDWTRWMEVDDRSSINGVDSNLVAMDGKHHRLYSVDEEEATDEALDDRIRNSFKGLDSDSKEAEDDNKKDLYSKHKRQFDETLLQKSSSWRRNRRKACCSQCVQYAIWYFRGFISMESQILHTTGSWTFFDSYLFPNHGKYWWRDVVYVVIGTLGLWWSRALFLKACITPFNVTGGQPDGLLSAIKRQDDFHRSRTA